jgi:hypothetical protein
MLQRGDRIGKGIDVIKPIPPTEEYARQYAETSTDN